MLHVHNSYLLGIARILNRPMEIPDFSYDASNFNHENFGCITVNKWPYHRISDFDEFYSALGYSDDIRAAGMLPDEFIWDRYIRNNATKTSQCFQSKIRAYLNNHSERFREEYGSKFANMIGKCISAKIDGSDLCLDCSCHPRFLY